MRRAVCNDEERKERRAKIDGGRGAGRMRMSDRMEEKGCWANATNEMEGGKLVKCLCRIR